MTSYTAHTRHDRPPVLVPDRWSWGAALFGPLWLAAHRAWLPAGLFAAVVLVAGVALPPGWVGLFALGTGILSGLMARDALRWSLDRRGYDLVHVLVARDEEGALARLLHARADLRDAFYEHVT